MTRKLIRPTGARTHEVHLSALSKLKDNSSQIKALERAARRDVNIAKQKALNRAAELEKEKADAVKRMQDLRSGKLPEQIHRKTISFKKEVPFPLESFGPYKPEVPLDTNKPIGAYLVRPIRSGSIAGFTYVVEDYYKLERELGRWVFVERKREFSVVLNNEGKICRCRKCRRGRKVNKHLYDRVDTLTKQQFDKRVNSISR